MATRADVIARAREAHAAIEALERDALAYAGAHSRPCVTHLSAEAKHAVGRIVAASGATVREGA